MKITLETLEAAAAETHFRAEMLEKVFHLVELLATLFSDVRIKEKIVLKGGTALNLFYFNVPRLSVDIDLNYIGSPDRERMLQERKFLESGIQEIALKNEFLSERKPSEEHAGGKWRFRYKSAFSGSAGLEVDLNYLCRVPLWDVSLCDSFSVAGRQAKNIRVLDKNEIAGSKLVALFARRKSRDLFDAHQILSSDQFDKENIRIAFLVYGAMARKDWRAINVEDLDFEVKELQNMLIPLLRSQAFHKRQETKQYAHQILDESKEMLSQFLPLRKNEKEFLTLLIDQGKIDGSLLSTDLKLQQNIERQPGLHWKVKNLEKMKNFSEIFM